MKSMKEIAATLSCENLFECIFGLNPMEMRVYTTLNDIGKGRVEEVSRILDRKKNAVYKSLQKLIIAGLVYREKMVFDGGGYCFVYKPVPKSEVLKEVSRIIDEFCVKVRKIIGEFADDSSSRLSGMRDV